jgi:hypothetical protein
VTGWTCTAALEAFSIALALSPGECQTCHKV